MSKLHFKLIDVFFHQQKKSWLKHGIENILSKSDKGELIMRLYMKRQFNFYTNNFGRCAFQRDFQRSDRSFDLDSRLNKVILVMEEVNLNSALAFLSLYLKKVFKIVCIYLIRFNCPNFSASLFLCSLHTGDFLQMRKAALRDHHGLLL